MSWADEGYQEYVINPLRDAKRDIDWIIKQAQRNSLHPKQLQQAIREAGKKLKTADEYFQGLLLE